MHGDATDRHHMALKCLAEDGILVGVRFEAQASIWVGPVVRREWSKLLLRALFQVLLFSLLRFCDILFLRGFIKFRQLVSG